MSAEDQPLILSVEADLAGLENTFLAAKEALDRLEAKIAELERAMAKARGKAAS